MNDAIKGDEPYVVSVNISEGGIPKRPIDSVFVNALGLKGDGHNHEKHYRFEQAVCLQDVEKLDELRGEGYTLSAGATGENLTARNINVNGLALGTVLEFPQGLTIEITKIRKACYVLDSIHPHLKEDIVGRCGMYAKVLNEGLLSIHDSIKIIKPDLGMLRGT